MEKVPTINDVAVHAGVSTATVSHVINNTRYVSEATTKKVLKAIEDLSFVPNASARSFKTGKRNTIGIIVPDISNPYFATIIEEAENALQIKGYSLIVANTKETIRREIHHLRTLSSGMVDGIILASTQEDYNDIVSLIPSNFPVVLLDRLPKNNTTDSVLSSDSDAIQHGVSALIAAGHTQIGYIAGLNRLSTTKDRFDAYRIALNNDGIQLDPDLVKYADSMARSACNCVQDLIDANCTAIVVGNNVMTVDTVNYIHHYIGKGGRPIKILGFSYNDWYPWLPNRDEIIQLDREIGKAVGKQIIYRIENNSAPIQTISFSSYYSHTNVNNLL